jgi:Ca2+/Na+ antiporter
VGETCLVDVASGDLKARRRETERWFVRAGLPHLIVDYTAREDILTRTAPFLTLVFVSELFLALNLDFPWWGNLLAFLGALALVLAVVIVANRLRDRRPLQRPDDIGIAELAIFLLVPPMIPLIFGGQVRQSLLTFGANLVLLGLAYVMASYAVLPTLRWGLRQLFVQFRTVGNLLARSLPLLLLFTMFMFLNAELWKVVDDLPRSLMVVALLILVGAGSAFVLLRLPTEIGETLRFSTWRDVEGELPDTPVEGMHVAVGSVPPEEPLTRRERVNVSVVIFFRHAIQILAVTVAIWLFYVLFGMFTIMETTVEQWTGRAEMNIWFSFDWFGNRVAVTAELMRTSLFIATIAGLQFAVAALTDPTYREESSAQITRAMRRVFAVREVYLAELVGQRSSP